MSEDLLVAVAPHRVALREKALFVYGDMKYGISSKGDHALTCDCLLARDQGTIIMVEGLAIFVKQHTGATEILEDSYVEHTNKILDLFREHYEK